MIGSLRGQKYCKASNKAGGVSQNPLKERHGKEMNKTFLVGGRSSLGRGKKPARYWGRDATAYRDSNNNEERRDPWL